MTDKAVSTEDLCVEPPLRSASLEAARLEAVLKTLIETKVESLKSAKRKSSSITSSPKSIFNKLRGNSTSTVSSSRGKEEIVPIHSQVSKSRQHSKERKEHRKRRTPRNSPKRKPSNVKKTHYDEDSNENFRFLQREQILDCGENCCCRQNPNEIQVHVDDDFISLNLEDYDNLEHEELPSERTNRQQRRRRRRRRRHRKHLKVAAVAVQVNELKELDDDELSQRARMTIALTAFLLLFMCLLLVGITLRMAPLIDDMVRKENEELMNSLDMDTHNLTVPTSIE